MSVTDALDAMRAEVPGCSMVLYADLKSGLVLSASSLGNPGQEALDAQSGAAQLALDGLLAEGARAVWAETGEAAPEMTWLLTGSDARLFLRSPGAAPEALVCLCAPDADFDKVADCGRRTLADILAISG